MLPKDKVMMGIIIDKEVKELIDIYAQDLGVSSSRFSRDLLYKVLQDYGLCKNNQNIKIGFCFPLMVSAMKIELEL